MARTKIKNEFQKYWHPEFRDWHENIIGIYHISSIGNSHQDLDSDEHSGPCLRQTYFEYTDPIPNSDETEGNFEEGEEHHKKLQKIIKKWKPNTVIEDPLARIFEKDGQKIIITGSIDITYKHLLKLARDSAKTKKRISIWDIKTASDYTLPKDRYDKNPTHFDQTSNYGTFLILYELNPKTNEIVRQKIIYTNKHNKSTHVQRQKFNLEKGIEKFSEMIDRAFYLDNCLKLKMFPEAEPMHWCKYCKYLKRCIEVGDVEMVMKGKYMKGLKIKEE